MKLILIRITNKSYVQVLNAPNLLSGLNHDIEQYCKCGTRYNTSNVVENKKVSAANSERIRKQLKSALRIIRQNGECKVLI